MNSMERLSLTSGIVRLTVRRIWLQMLSSDLFGLPRMGIRLLLGSALA